MVRLSAVSDAEQLNELNNEFNGEGETTAANIRESLLNNRQEVVVVDERDGTLTGFVCIQMKRSFCYDDYTPEITEVYVKPEYRNRGIAGEMIRFGENYCRRNYPLTHFELLTGFDNVIAQSVYRRLGYRAGGEIYMAKQIEAQTALENPVPEERES